MLGVPHAGRALVELGLVELGQGAQRGGARGPLLWRREPPWWCAPGARVQGCGVVLGVEFAPGVGELGPLQALG